MDAGDWIAAFTAFVSSGVAINEVAKYRKSRNRLKIEIISEGRVTGEVDSFLIITVVNVSGIPLTISGLLVEAFTHPYCRYLGKSEISFLSKDPTHPQLPSLPITIGPGEEWTGFARHDNQTLNYLKAGKLWITVRCLGADAGTKMWVNPNSGEDVHRNIKLKAEEPDWSEVGKFRRLDFPLFDFITTNETMNEK